MEEEEEEKEWKGEWIESYMKGRKIRGKIKEGGGEQGGKFDEGKEMEGGVKMDMGKKRRE